MEMELIEVNMPSRSWIGKRVRVIKDIPDNNLLNKEGIVVVNTNSRYDVVVYFEGGRRCAFFFNELQRIS